jgi:hypothetical protein
MEINLEFKIKQKQKKYITLSVVLMTFFLYHGNAVNFMLNEAIGKWWKASKLFRLIIGMFI